MTLRHKNRSKCNALNRQIFTAEQQLIRQRQSVSKSSSYLVRHLRQRMTEPAVLFLAGEVGFIVAELTKRQPQQTSSAIKGPQIPNTTVLSVMHGCLAFMHELYAALPLILMAKSYFTISNSSHPSENQHHPIP